MEDIRVHYGELFIPCIAVRFRQGTQTCRVVCRERKPFGNKWVKRVVLGDGKSVEQVADELLSALAMSYLEGQEAIDIVSDLHD